MKGCFKQLVGCLFVIFIFVASKTSLAQVELTSGEYPPYTSAALANFGVTTHIVEQVFNELKHSVTMSFLPWKRGFELTSRGDFSATFPYLKNSEREELFYFSAPVVAWKSRVFTANNSELTYQSVSDLKGRIECLPFHYGSLAFLDKMFFQGEITRERPALIESCWKMLQAGRVDFFVEDELVAEIYIHAVEKLIIENFNASQKVVSADYGYVLFPKSKNGSLELRDKFNEALRELQINGTIETFSLD